MREKFQVEVKRKRGGKPNQVTYTIRTPAIGHHFPTGDLFRAVKLTIEEGRLTLNVVNPEQGSASEELVADFSGDDFDIGFNARYLMDITAALNGDQAQFLFADAGSPTIVRDAGEKADAATLYVIMPMRV